MCGIVAVPRRPATRLPPDRQIVVDALERAVAHLDGALDLPSISIAIDAAAEAVESVDALLRGTPGIRALLGDAGLAVLVEHQVETLDVAASRVDGALDELIGSASELESVNASLVRFRDAVWAVGRDRLRTARAVADLAGADLGDAALEVFHRCRSRSSAIDRLEVRGRDSAGLHVLLYDHGLDLDEPSVARLLDERHDPLFGSGAVRAADGELSFVYKAAAEIGELGDNTAVLRAAIRDDGCSTSPSARPTRR